MVRSIFLIYGILSLILAFIGIFLPVLPTVPLVLLSSFFFSKSSRRFHSWLLRNRTFGPIIKDWEETKSELLYLFAHLAARKALVSPNKMLPTISVKFVPISSAK